MKTPIISRAAMTFIVANLCLCTSTAVYGALVFPNPLTYATLGIVGTRDGTEGAQSPSQMAVYAQEILDAVGLGVTIVSPSDSSKWIKTSTLFDYSGTISGDSFAKGEDLGNNIIPAGWDYVIAKYNGPNAGLVLFKLGGQDAIIPQYPYDFWTQNTTQYGLSQWVAFNPIPEPTTMVAASLLMLPFAASMLRRFHRRSAG
jgi:hypothetical protein